MKILQGIIIGVGSLLSLEILFYGLWNHDEIGFFSLIIATITFGAIKAIESETLF